MFSLKPRRSVTIRRSDRGLAIAAAILALTFGLAAHAQTFTVIHNFTGGEGYAPWGLTIDQAGNLYGATVLGGTHNAGVVFRMTKRGSAWTLLPLYDFSQSDGDGASPWGVVIGSNGRLYGTTDGGGFGYGTVFSLSPPASTCPAVLCPWTETQLHLFTDESDDGAYPANADLVFDQQGNIYGTTAAGGSGSCTNGCGTVYELSQHNGVWSLSVLYSFQGYNPSDFSPFGGVVFDQAGDLYGTAQGGPDNFGTVYELSPNNGSWAKSTIFFFDGGGNGSSGAEPYASLLRDGSGNLYGTAAEQGPNWGGTVFELTPSNGGWNFNLLYGLSGGTVGPQAPLTQDAAGNLYGTTYTEGAYGRGNVFKLTPANGSWTYTSLHDFDGSDGWGPESRVVMDAEGNLYGTTVMGGPENPACGGSGASCGVVWEITP